MNANVLTLFFLLYFLSLTLSTFCLDHFASFLYISKSFGCSLLCLVQNLLSGHLFKNVNMCACINVCVNSLDFILFTSSIPFLPTVNWSLFCVHSWLLHISVVLSCARLCFFFVFHFFLSFSVLLQLILFAAVQLKIEVDNEHTHTVILMLTAANTH